MIDTSSEPTLCRLPRAHRGGDGVDLLARLDAQLGALGRQMPDRLRVGLDFEPEIGEDANIQDFS